ncbi:hypothetical protein K474DRAFT_1668521 [Panus rudis PR-1116 ss-1]|nr:hypothetical protein K474DRAFT_1668521 [Panus rudis PR-1116 ss-1]
MASGTPHVRNLYITFSTAESGTIGLTFSWGLNALDDDFADEFVQRYHAIAKATVDSDDRNICA